MGHQDGYAISNHFKRTESSLRIETDAMCEMAGEDMALNEQNPH